MVALNHLHRRKKKDQVRESLVPAEIEEITRKNLQTTLEYLLANKDKEFKNSDELREFVNKAAVGINKDLIKDDTAITRSSDSDKYPYTKVSDLKQAMDQFYDELLPRLNDPNQDPEELAAFIEYRIDLTDHFFVDGSGRTAKAVSTWSLARANHELPKYGTREEYYAHAPTQIRGQDAEVDKRQWGNWLEYYKTLFETKNSS
jgi:hypothetical protein